MSGGVFGCIPDLCVCVVCVCGFCLCIYVRMRICMYTCVCCVSSCPCGSHQIITEFIPQSARMLQFSQECCLIVAGIYTLNRRFVFLSLCHIVTHAFATCPHMCQPNLV